MKRNALSHSVFVFLLLAVAVLPMQAQDCSSAKKDMETALKIGNCKEVEKFYNETYIGIYKCQRDKNNELKIVNCGKDNKPKPKPTPTLTPPTQTAGNDQTITVNGVSFKMVYVEGGTFTMGCTSEQGEECADVEKPAHSVTLSSYYIGETEVTQSLWRAVMGNNPSYYKGDDLPVEYVSWDVVQSFILALNRKTGRTFRLPTEAEWEYAARGGNKSSGYKYSGSNTIGDVALCRENSGEKTHPVKTKKANELGLYDMSGNVWEWCEDRYGNYGSSIQTNPKGPSSGSGRVFRGGCWDDSVGDCRVSFRDGTGASSRTFSLGFRLVLVQ